MFTQESLSELRQRIDLVEVLSSHLQMSRSGASFKALCPFHEEKTPSFIVHRGDSHYHCFGCGAHGDAIAFLMTHVRLSFAQAVESLAERFQVSLEKVEILDSVKGPSRAELKRALEHASQLYHYLLLHSEEGRMALGYLYDRGLTINFLRRFQVGYAPSQKDLLIRYLRAHDVEEEVMREAGLITRGQGGRKRDFFSDRIVFPIQDVMGSVIGFSARKFKEETFGGKYINTPETPLFKKSRVLFGLHHSRGRIAKEQQVIVVEGQIDCLRLIDEGFNYTVAGQGTAFGEEHVKELIHFGVKKVYLALDADRAGQEAAVKIGQFFQKKGIEVLVVSLPQGEDPDSLLVREGAEGFQKLLEGSQQYLTFLYAHLAEGVNLSSPSVKSGIVSAVVEKIKEWERPVMVHEALRQFAEISQVPEAALGIGSICLPELFIKKRESLIPKEVDPDRILEGDFLRWLIFSGSHFGEMGRIAKANIEEKHFRLPVAYRLYSAFLSAYEKGKTCDLFTIGEKVAEEEDQKFLTEIMQRKVNLLKAIEGFRETVHRMLIREWMEERERIRIQLQNGGVAEEEALELVKRFDQMKNNIPQVV